MRVLHLITRPQRRGAEVFALTLCEELERQGHATSVIALYRPEPGGALPLRPRDGRLDGDPSSLLERAPGVQPSLLAALASRVCTFAPDVLQVNGSRSVKYGSLLRRMHRRAGWALVYRSIGNPEDWLRGPLHRFLYRHLVVAPVDGLVAVSRATLESLERCYRPRVPTTVLPRAIDPRPFETPVDRREVRRRLGATTDAPVLLFVGRLSPEKRPDRLLRVAAAVARRCRAAGTDPPELWIAGTGPLAGEIAADAAQAPLPVRMLGERDDVPRLMAGADLLLLTSDTEGTPGVLLEAAFAGVPAVATRVGGVEDCVVDGETGLLVDPLDEEGMARRIAALLADPGRRWTLGETARARAAESFSIAPIARSYVEHYRVVLARRRSRPAGSEGQQ